MIDAANLPAPSNEHPQTPAEIAARLRTIAYEMDCIAVLMDYYGGLSEWAKHGREMAGAGAIARQWAEEIEKPVPLILNKLERDV